jgi:hypothetical protein
VLTFFKRFFVAFLWDELAFVRWMRGLMLMFATSGVAFGQQIADTLGQSGWVTKIKLVALACAFFAGSITAGQRNPKTPEVQP